MNKTRLIIIIFISLSTAFIFFHHFYNPKTAPQRKDVHALKSSLEAALDAQSEIFPDEKVIKFSFPRKDINASVDGWALDTFMGLTTWISFKPGKQEKAEIMVMGDLVLLKEEVHSVMATALAHNISITALHNHFFFDNSNVYFMHIESEGSLENISSSIRKMLDAIKQKSTLSKKDLPVKNTIAHEPLEEIIRSKSTQKDGMVKFVIGRTITAGCGCSIGKNMGINTWIAFGGTDDNAIVCGDFAVHENELQPILAILCSASTQVVAIHNHMTHENPRLIFVHYWGQGAAADLAHIMKSALDITKN